MESRANWLNSLTWQVSFYNRGHSRRRLDTEMDWRNFDTSSAGSFFSTKRRLKSLLHRLGLNVAPPLSVDWLYANVRELWDTRELLDDELSRLLFDSSLIVRLTSHRRYYFPRIDFVDIIQNITRSPFNDNLLPTDYLGLPLSIYRFDCITQVDTVPLTTISTEPQISGLNSYRQYLINRNGFDMRPKLGETVLDCGACIGDFSTIFAAFVGASGQVHAFDPIPLHNRYCSEQALLNPSLARSLHFNILAVGASSFAHKGDKTDSIKIDPGKIKIDSFDCTTIDDYAKANLTRVDFIKMDIEGAELDAIIGAHDTIAEHKPRLAISGYHKPEDLWEIPQKLKALNPSYKFLFGHHSPVHWESVFYAA